ncbi:MAG: hypothetical protein AAGA35_00805 [Patescibacteria group bacterium]
MRKALLLISVVLMSACTSWKIEYKQGIAYYNGVMVKRAVESIPRDMPIVIVESPGGYFDAYKLLLDRWVQIEGSCQSACLWLLVSSERICWAPSASFHAHAWHQGKNLKEINTLVHIALTREPLFEYLLSEQKLHHTSETVPIPKDLISQAYKDKQCWKRSTE